MLTMAGCAPKKLCLVWIRLQSLWLHPARCLVDAAGKFHRERSYTSKPPLLKSCMSRLQIPSRTSYNKQTKKTGHLKELNTLFMYSHASCHSNQNYLTWKDVRKNGGRWIGADSSQYLRIIRSAQCCNKPADEHITDTAALHLASNHAQFQCLTIILITDSTINF